MLIKTDFSPIETRFTGINGLYCAGYKPPIEKELSRSFEAVLSSQHNQDDTHSEPTDGLPMLILVPATRLTILS